MKVSAPGSFGAQLKALRETAGFTQEELATIAGLSVHAVSALERGERRRPQVETVRALAAAFDLDGPALEAFLGSARPSALTDPHDDPGGSLPLSLTPLVGRDGEMDALRQWLGDGITRLITLAGPGGVGKTRLALDLGRSLAQDESFRVVFVPLAAIRDPAFVAPAIAEALGLTEVGAADLARRARSACGDRPLLLILDNFEQVIDAAPAVAGLLSSVPCLKVLVTSRAPLRLRGEREYVLGPLALQPNADDLSLDDFVRVPAVRLFVERVRDISPDFRLTTANAATIAAICRRLDALPLALELAAPWLKVQSPENLLRRLTQDVLLTTPGTRDLPERQRTMNATVAWSYQLLHAEEQRAFRRFGALPGLFPIDAAAEVLAGRAGPSGATVDHALAMVSSLMDKSLLVRAETSAVPTCALYYMLDTVRAYATLALTDSGERDDAVEGLVRYCAAEAALARQGLVGTAQVEWLGRVREDLDNYRLVLGWLIEQGRGDEASEIAASLLFFFLIRGHAAEGLRWYEQILDLPSLPPLAAGRTLLAAAAMSHTLGDSAGARARVTKGLARARECGDDDAIAEASWMFGHVEFADGALDAARDWFTRSRETFAARAIPWGIGAAASGLAWVALSSGDQVEADRLVTAAMASLEPAGPWFLALGLYIRVVLELHRGNADRVIALMRQSLARVNEAQDRFAVVYGLVPLAIAAAMKGEDAWMARILGAREAISDRTGTTVVDPFLRELCERTERAARQRLGADRWAASFNDGRQSSIETMLGDIDAAIG
jgi:predicted ATPase/transcriptional regulator with XRE-family HTH domain